MPAMAQASSLSEVSPEIPTAPMMSPAALRIRTPPGLVTTRPPDQVEMGILRETLQEHLTRYRANPKAAQQLIRVGESAPAPTMNAEELAAWTMLGNLVLNLDEVINR